jgi:nucleoside-diphosphate-sugar epimerase
VVIRPAVVTGATGGLGRVLVARLREQGRAVVAIGRNTDAGRELEAMGASFVPADLSDADLLPILGNAGTVFHLAALSSPWGAEQDFVAANILATERLVTAARDAGCTALVFTSTPSVYTQAADRLGIDESSPLPSRPANAYARTKMAAERIVLAADSAAMRTIAIRPKAIIGPYDKVLLPRLLRVAAKGTMPLPRGGKALLEPTDVRDVVAALLAAEARVEQAGGRVFNISGGVPITLKALAARVFAKIGRDVRFVPMPASLLLAIGTILKAAGHLRPGSPEPLLTRYGAMTLGWSQTFDLSAARTVLDWQPHHHPLAAIDWALSEMRIA